MTTITVDGADRAIDAGEWLNERKINYEIFGIGVLSSEPKYQFKFANSKDATHFALRWR
jgi:hypothetical protein